MKVIDNGKGPTLTAVQVKDGECVLTSQDLRTPAMRVSLKPGIYLSQPCPGCMFVNLQTGIVFVLSPDSIMFRCDATLTIQD